MVEKEKDKITKTVDYNQSLKKFHDKKVLKRIIYNVQTHINLNNNDDNVITIKIGTSEKSLSVAETIIILNSTKIIVENICVALGYKVEDIDIQLASAKPGCFVIDILITIAKGAIAKYCTGFTEEFFNIDFEKEGRRQAKMIKEIFQNLMTSPKIKNASSFEARNILTAKSEIFKTLYSNNSIKNVNFTNEQTKKITRTEFLDYIA